MARQLVRSDEVRAPQSLSDTLTDAQRKQLAADIVAGNTTDYTNQQFQSIVASQLKQAQGGPTWLDQAPPSPAVHETQSFDEPLLGVMDGTNAVFTTQAYYLPSTLLVYYNGIQLHRDNDFIMLESGGLGTGYDTVTLVNHDGCLPLAWERLTASYFRNI